MEKVIKDKLSELDSLKDPLIPKGVDIHIFEMKKCGKGWKTMGYEWSNTGIIDPYRANSDLILKEHATLSKIKKNFEWEEKNAVVTCTIDGHLTAPSTIFQLIIECNNISQECIISILKENIGLNFTCLLQYKWVDEIDQNILKKLLEF